MLKKTKYNFIESYIYPLDSNQKKEYSLKTEYNLFTLNKRKCY